MELAILNDEISLDLDESVRYAKEFGLRKFEIRCIDAYEHRVPNFLPGRLEQLCELVDDKSFEITALTPGTFKIGLSETERLRLELDDILPRTCALAVRLGAPRLITFGFLREAGFEESDAIARLTEAAAIAADHGLELSVELGLQRGVDLVADRLRNLHAGHLAD